MRTKKLLIHDLFQKLLMHWKKYSRYFPIALVALFGLVGCIPNSNISGFGDVAIIIFFPVVAIAVFLWDRRRTRTITTVQSWAAKNGLILDQPAKNPYVTLSSYHPIFSASGTWQNQALTFGVGGSAGELLVFFNIDLLGSLSGEVLIRQSGTTWPGHLDQVALEATTFKTFLTVLARPKQLATLVVHPDFMAWYETFQPRPMISIQGNRSCIFYRQETVEQDIDRLAESVPAIITFIERSGALDPVRGGTDINIQ